MRDSNSRMSRAVGQYLQDMRARNLSAEYVNISRMRLYHFAEWMEGEGVVNVNSVDTATLVKYLETLRGYSKNYQAAGWNTIRLFLKFHDNPLAMKMKWHPMGRDRQVQWLTEEQLDFLLTQPMTPREAFMVTASALGMLRRIEVLRLNLADLHLARRTGRLSVWAKGKVRTVPVHPDFMLAIEAYLATQDREMGAPALTFKQRRYEQILKEIQRRTGVPCTAHTLRRTGLRMLNSLGVPLPTISAIAGHSDPMTTLRYIGAPIDDMENAIALLRPKIVRAAAEPDTALP